MFDKVKLKLNKEHLPAGYDWTSVIDNVNVCNRGYYEGGDGGWGEYRGRKIRAKNDYVIFEGSLSKCLFGNNIQTLTLAQVRQVIEMIGEELGVPMENAEVLELEFATNLTMSRRPVEYIRLLNGMKGYQKMNVAETVYFKNRQTQIKFYDKVLEAKKKRELPKHSEFGMAPYQLRYEVTFSKKSLAAMFGRTLQASDLWNKKVFYRLVAEWFGLYEEIDKLSDSPFGVTFNDIRTMRDFYTWCICIADVQQNMACYVKELFHRRDNPQAEDRQAHSHIQRVIRSAQSWKAKHVRSSALIDELTGTLHTYLQWLLDYSTDGMTVEEQRELFGC